MPGIKKSEAEPKIRSLVHDWAHEVGFTPESGELPSFSKFTTWLHGKGFGYLLSFRSTMGPQQDAEYWFDQELQQTWRN